MGLKQLDISVTHSNYLKGFKWIEERLQKKTNQGGYFNLSTTTYLLFVEIFHQKTKGYEIVNKAKTNNF